jgi:hypothetical protein
MPEQNVLGIDLGTSKSGICWLEGSKIASLQCVKPEKLIPRLDELRKAHGPPSVVVVDVPIDPTSASGFRLVDRVFMRGLFNNNHVGLQPNNPDLLDLTATFEPLRAWCKTNAVTYCNKCPVPQTGILREAMPNIALGMLCKPDNLLAAKKRLRFRYGRGANIAPIVVIFECLQGTVNGFFEPLIKPPISWEALEKLAEGQKQWQADDLIAALTCGTLGWWCCHSTEVGYVQENRGHYLLPPARFHRPEWLSELRKILLDDDFAAVQTNLLQSGTEIQV